MTIFLLKRLLTTLTTILYDLYKLIFE